MSSWWEPGSPAWSPPPSSPTPAGGSSCSTRRARPTSAARRTGPSAGCSSSTALSSAGWASATRSTWPGRTGRAAPAGIDRARRTTGPGSGRRPTSSGRPARSARGCTSRGMRVLPRRRLGRARRRHARRARQLGAALPHPVGHRAPACVAPFERRVREHVAAGRVDLPACATASTSSWCTGGAVTGVRGVGARARRRRAGAGPPTARSSASSSTAARRSSSPRAASAATTTWCGPTGPSRLGTPPEPTCSPACRPTSTAGCSPSPRRPVARSSTATGCGTTSRASATGTPSGRGTRSASCPARARCGSTRAGNRLPAPLFPGFDTLGTLAHLRHTGLDHSWFILNRSHHRQGVRALRLGAEPRPHRAGRYREVLRRPTADMPEPVQAFLDHGEDFVTPPASASSSAG